MGEKSPFQSQAHYCIASRWIIHVCAKCGIVTSFCNETMENKKLDVAEDKSVKSKPYTRPKKKKKKTMDWCAHTSSFAKFCETKQKSKWKVNCPIIKLIIQRVPNSNPKIKYNC